MKRTICSMVFGACLFLAGASDASAHDTGYRSHIVHDNYDYGRTRSVPVWLKRDREFQRWYLHNRYRFVRRMAWTRIYDRYLFERRYRRHHRKYYGNANPDRGYRSYQKKWKKRKY